MDQWGTLLIGLKGTIGDVHGFPRRRALELLKLIILIMLGAPWVHRALGDTLNSIASTSHFGKRSAARVMTISSFDFLTNVTNIVFYY